MLESFLASPSLLRVSSVGVNVDEELAKPYVCCTLSFKPTASASSERTCD